MHFGATVIFPPNEIYYARYPIDWIIIKPKALIEYFVLQTTQYVYNILMYENANF